MMDSLDSMDTARELRVFRIERPVTGDVVVESELMGRLKAAPTS
jgi:hypothetical protein